MPSSVPLPQVEPVPGPDYFCVVPFVHLQLPSNGNPRVCCKFLDNLTTPDGQPMSVYQHSLKEIWNSEEMRSIRRDLVEGKAVTACAQCYQEDAAGSYSLRVGQNTRWLGGWCNDAGLSVDELKAKASADDYQVATLPQSLELDVGNLCNLKCRMCIGDYSLRIGRDPVHGRWANSVKLLPGAVASVSYEGFHPAEESEDATITWTQGEASVRFPYDPQLRTVHLHLKVDPLRPEHQRVRIAVNGTPVFDDVPKPGPWRPSFEIGSLVNDPVCDLTLSSPTFQHPDGRTVGVGIEELELNWSYERSHQPDPHRAGVRFTDGEHWFKQKSFVREELLRDPARLRFINFLGGEPLIIKEIGDTLQYLVEAGVSENIDLQITTNATTTNSPWLKLTSHFKSLHLSLSVDGYGEYYEYIRYPAKWDAFVANVAVLRRLPKTTAIAGVTIQAYNLLNLVELLRFLDTEEIPYGLSPLYAPEYLNVTAMPPAARRLAAARLHAYADEECPPLNREMVHGLATFIKPTTDVLDRKLLREFMLFTNDLDISRGQSFRATHAELLELIEQSGFPWTDETLHATRRPLELVAS